MEEFCGSQFWDTDLSWNTESSQAAPDLTPCFQNTVLVWIPCGFLWIFSLLNLILFFGSTDHHDGDRDSNFSNNVGLTQNSHSETKVEFRTKISNSNSTSKEIRFTRSGPTRTSSSTLTTKVRPKSRGSVSIPWNVLNVSKVIICLLLILTQILRLSSTLKLELSHFIVYPVDTYIPVLRIATYALVLGTIVISKTKGTRSSITQFTFWFLLVTCQLFKFRTTILTVYNSSDKSTFRHGSETDTFTMTVILELIDYPLILGQFLLHCWADSSGNEKVGIPTQHSCDEKLECPENSSSALSRLFFFWFDSIAWTGRQKSLETKDLWNLNEEDTSRTIATLFDESWGKKLSKIAQSNSKKKSTRSVGVLSVIWSTFGGTFMAGSSLRLISDSLAFASPQILSLLIAFMSSDEDDWKGYFYAALLFLAAFVTTLVEARHHHVMYTTGMRVKSALVSVLYRKSLVVSNSSKQDSTTGEIVNLMSVDVQNVVNVIPYINMIWRSPLQISVALYFLWDVLGPSVFAGVGVMVLLIPINGVLGEFVRAYQVKQMTNKDERVKLISEILSGIKILKLYAWEPSFQEEVMKIRGKEIQTLNKMAYLNAVNDFLWTCSQFLVAIATFGTYVLVDERNVLDAQKVFVALSLLNVMTVPLTALPMVIVWAIQAGVSLGRLNKFMNAEEIDTDAITHDEGEVDPIVIEKGYFSWNGSDESEPGSETCDREGSQVLKNINLRVQEGSLVAVVGPVGSGKSSLLSAILGELEKTSGRVNTKGCTSYVSQQAWIQNGTLQENILFGKSYNVLKYSRVIDACALGPDLDIFPGRDKIEIGEKGINLSGGQKQRVSIARAVYNNSDLYLLDDPLSAVDSHVGKHIFDKVLSSKGLLGRKTRVLVTNALHFLHQVDHIVVMKNGEISQTGTYDELLAQKGEFAELLAQYTTTETETEIKDQTRTQTTDEPRKQSVTFQIQTPVKLESSGEGFHGSSRKGSHESGLLVEDKERLIGEETMETEGVKWSIYFDYFRAAGWGRVLPAFFMYVVYQAFAIGSNFWLTVWSNEPIVNGTQGNRDLYLGVYAGLGLAQSCAFMVATVLLCLAVIRSASVFHLNMLARILRAPMSFFDTTPTGRIVNRFSKDVDVLDNTLSFLIRSWLSMMAGVLGTIFIIIYSTPIFVVVIIPIGLFYYFVQKFYVPTSRQLKRLESVTRSPIYSHFSETINGASTIRAYGEQQRFITESEIKVDENQACYYPSIVSNRWLSVRIETAGALIIFFAALFAVLSRDSLNPGLVGLTITYALQITYCLSYLVRSVCDVEANIVAVERLKEYGEVPQEAPWKSDWRKPPNTWPAYGSVEFKNYQTRYREGMDLVLRNITCRIEPGEKIGVVGRTGAGKSSLTLALFRIIEGVNGGTITIDGENIRKLGLHDIRSRLTIIPQDPVLFSGTLRFNLDPFGKYSDSAVWRALELSNLKTFVEGLQGELEFKVSEGGDNMSVGQKQLVCLARALLRKSKILVLDEATAAVDLETDDLIQKTIRTEFKDSTVITIAHRLNTIMDSNRVMVIDNGSVREFEMPGKLLENKESHFYSMANDAGLISNADL